MLYIFEGLPGAGKTTLINELAIENNLPIVEQILKHNKYLNNPVKYYSYNDFLKYKKVENLSMKNSIVIMDRGYLSTLAYNYAFDILFNTNHFKTLKKEYGKFNSYFNLEFIYILINVDLNTSLLRKGRTTKSDYIWCNKVFLSSMSDFYRGEIYDFVDPQKIKIVNGQRPFEIVLKEVEDIIYGKSKTSVNKRN